MTYGPLLDFIFILFLDLATGSGPTISKDTLLKASPGKSVRIIGCLTLRRISLLV